MGRANCSKFMFSVVADMTHLLDEELLKEFRAGCEKDELDLPAVAKMLEDKPALLADVVRSSN
eukprot:36873-Lingulodinium_polyedra.AAC.1